ncbi:glycosyltransferase family 2 protein [Flavobacterium subsaxonicum]|uniref:glycosyltransferase family 2 protein n=1 Tax=Flavobacterium subsaxonicum TaxID=426226 RepID=UPI0004202796|nr:glycosyltransferase family A protein [Flavobacterium subsaxonicum]
MNRVSIIIPTYNRAEEIIKCLDSLVSQTYTNIEIIVVDDGSVDDTEQAIKAYCLDKSLPDGKLVYYKQKNQGAPTARNFGLKNATGNFVVFFDSDDLMFPDRIRLQAEAMTKEGSDSCAGGFTDSANGKKFIPNLDESKGVIGSLIHWKIMGSTQCWMYKKELLDKLGGYDVSYACYQDWDLTFRYLSHNPKVAVVKESLTLFVNDDRNDRITSQVQSQKRLPHIQRYYLKVLKWLLNNNTNTQTLNHTIFIYVNQIVFGYYKNGLKSNAKEALKSFGVILKQAPGFLAVKCKTILYYYLFRRLLRV